jgi:hypothetical protein
MMELLIEAPVSKYAVSQVNEMTEHEFDTDASFVRRIWIQTIAARLSTRHRKPNDKHRFTLQWSH